MANNRGVVYAGPGKVEVQSIDFPKLALGSRKCEHGVILKLGKLKYFTLFNLGKNVTRPTIARDRGSVVGHKLDMNTLEGWATIVR